MHEIISARAVKPQNRLVLLGCGTANRVSCSMREQKARRNLKRVTKNQHVGTFRRRLLDSTDYETTAGTPLSAQVSRHENTAYVGRRAVGRKGNKEKGEGGTIRLGWSATGRKIDTLVFLSQPFCFLFVFVFLFCLCSSIYQLKNYQPAGFEPKKSGHSAIFLTAASFTGASDGVFACALERCFPVLPASLTTSRLQSLSPRTNVQCGFFYLVPCTRGNSKGRA